jgi:hypothetical protein
VWEKYEMSYYGTNTVALKSFANGKYVCAENAGASPLIANRDRVGPWELFEIIPRRNGIAFRAVANRKLVCAENAGGSFLIANRDHADLWETFSLEYF